MHCMNMHRGEVSIHPFSDYVNFEFFNMLSHVWPEDGFITDRNMLVNVCMFILIQSVQKCVNWNPQNGWYIRHYELAHVTIKPVTSAVRTTVPAASTAVLSWWKTLSRLHPSVLCLSTRGVHVLRSPNLLFILKKLLTTGSWKCSHFST